MKATSMARLAAALILLAAWHGPSPATAQDFPARVLITNDNGIDDPKIVALARAFAARTETWVVAPAEDRSGSGNYLTVTRVGGLEIEERDLGPGIRAFAVDGFPADCVVLALLGLLADATPDLVISGINGGVNSGGDWMFSGTVGAARVAALAGVPAIAVSGLDDDIPGAVDAAVDWVVRLAGSDVVRALGPLGYLTVSLPRVAPDEIRGVRVTDRAPLRFVPRLAAASATEWRVVGEDEVSGAPPVGSDDHALAQGFIAVVPMRAAEVDPGLLRRWRDGAPGLPRWTGGGRD